MMQDWITSGKQRLFALGMERTTTLIQILVVKVESLL